MNGLLRLHKAFVYWNIAS